MFCLEGLNRPDAVEFFRHRGGQLERRIEYSFENKFFVADLQHEAQGAARAVEWLIGQITGRIGRNEQA